MACAGPAASAATQPIEHKIEEIRRFDMKDRNPAAGQDDHDLAAVSDAVMRGPAPQARSAASPI